MTRGRHRNVAHLVAESIEDARSQWVDIFNRDRADLGPGHAAERAADDLDRYGPKRAATRHRLQAAALREAALDRSHHPNDHPDAPHPTAVRGIGR